MLLLPIHFSLAALITLISLGFGLAFANYVRQHHHTCVCVGVSCEQTTLTAVLLLMQCDPSMPFNETGIFRFESPR